MNVRDSSTLVAKEVMIFWEKARIPTRPIQHCIAKVELLYSTWRGLQRNASRTTEVETTKRETFVNELNNLFDITHGNVLETLDEERKQFLFAQRETGRVGYIGDMEYGESRNDDNQTQLKFQHAEERRNRVYDELQQTSKI